MRTDTVKVPVRWRKAFCSKRDEKTGWGRRLANTIDTEQTERRRKETEEQEEKEEEGEESR